MATLETVSAYPPVMLVDAAFLCGWWVNRVPSWCWR